jgi:hypothetical protein
MRSVIFATRKTLMKTGHIAAAVALFGIALAATCPRPAIAQQDAAATDIQQVPDAPYTRWLYGLDGSRARESAVALALDGSPADGKPYDHEVSLQPGTRAVTVVHNETVKFVAPNGQEFRWKFDTPRTVVSLSRIAPADIALPGNVAVFVTGDSPSDRG